jgi:hypothetical protein
MLTLENCCITCIESGNLVRHVKELKKQYIHFDLKIILSKNEIVTAWNVTILIFVANINFSCKYIAKLLVSAKEIVIFFW